MRNLDAHFSCQDASLVLQCFYGLHVCGQYIACYYTEHILSPHLLHVRMAQYNSKLYYTEHIHAPRIQHRGRLFFYLNRPF